MKPRNAKTCIKSLSYTCLLLLLVSWGVNAQKVIDVPLSKPGKPGKLKMGITYGSIKIIGYNGKTVKVSSDRKSVV